jgi:hypothetical protein
MNRGTRFASIRMALTTSTISSRLSRKKFFWREQWRFEARTNKAKEPAVHDRWHC